MKSDRIRVVVVDDHPLWREAVVNTLGARADFHVVGQGDSAKEAIALAGDLLPDLMLLDVSMPGGGLSAAKEIGENYPVIKIVMLTVSEDEDVVMGAIKAHAKGYVLKGVSGDELIHILHTIAAGESYITPTLAGNLLIESEHVKTDIGESILPATLTERERQILTRLSTGLSNKQIASDLHLSEKTIKHYMTNLMQKLQVRNRVEAALVAQRAMQGKEGSV